MELVTPVLWAPKSTFGETVEPLFSDAEVVAAAAKLLRGTRAKEEEEAALELARTLLEAIALISCGLLSNIAPMVLLKEDGCCCCC